MKGVLDFLLVDKEDIKRDKNSDIFADFIFENMNDSISHSAFPSALKLANITPVHKKDSKSKKGLAKRAILSNIILRNLVFLLEYLYIYCGLGLILYPMIQLEQVFAARVYMVCLLLREITVCPLLLRASKSSIRLAV